MAPTDTLSVRLTHETRETLIYAAASHDVAGASALAREILEKWARKIRQREVRDGMRKAVSYMLEHPDWDAPEDFFPAIKEIAKEFD